MRSARDRFADRNINSMLIESLYGGGPRGAVDEPDGGAGAPRWPALIASGARRVPASNSRRLSVGVTEVVMATILQPGRRALSGLLSAFYKPYSGARLLCSPFGYP